MSYPVDFYEGGVKLASGIADATDKITGVTPFLGRGLAYRRQIQIVVTGGEHAGASITAQIKGEDGNAVTLFDRMPFLEKA
jgi:hypothetical protein